MKIIQFNFKLDYQYGWRHFCTRCTCCFLCSEGHIQRSLGWLDEERLSKRQMKHCWKNDCQAHRRTRTILSPPFHVRLILCDRPVLFLYVKHGWGCMSARANTEGRTWSQYVSISGSDTDPEGMTWSRSSLLLSARVSWVSRMCMARLSICQTGIQHGVGRSIIYDSVLPYSMNVQFWNSQFYTLCS